MAELLYPTSAELEGPWLISGDQLEALDGIVDEQVASLEASIERRLSQASEKRLERRLLVYKGEEKPSEEKMAAWLEEWRSEERANPRLSAQAPGPHSTS
jgi:hypothetical protein